MKNNNQKKVLILLVTTFIIYNCKNSGSQKEKTFKDPITGHSSNTKDIGVGPIKKLNLEELNETLASKGKEIFDAKCTACHKIDTKFIGPAILGVTNRREPEWIMNMILNPENMVKENEIAKKLLIEYNGAPMANQNLTEDEARAVLEYFRKIK